MSGTLGTIRWCAYWLLIGWWYGDGSEGGW
jgi:hypothetical protein